MRQLAILVLLLFTGPLAPVVNAQTPVATDVAEDATAHNSQPKIGRDRAGTIYLTFAKPAGGADQIFVASSPDQGRTWRLRQITTGAVDSRFSSLAVGPDGQVHLAWTQYDDGVGKVYYTRFDRRRWTVPARLSPGAAYAGIPAVAVDPQGRPHVVWYGIRREAPSVRTRHGSIYEILYTGFTGSQWTAPEVISPGVPDAINPTLAADARGMLHSAWYQFDSRVYQVRYAARDLTWHRPVQISSGSADAFAVAMAVDAGGGIDLVWERREQGGIRIFFAERLRGRSWSGQEPVTTAGGRATNPTIALNRDGHVYVAWESDGQLFLRRRQRQWLGTNRIESHGRNTNPALAGTAGAVDLMWTQQVGEARPRLRFATLDGSTRPTASAPPGIWAIVILVVFLIGALWQRARRQKVRGADDA